MPRKRETFREAHTRIKAELAALGWKIHEHGPNGQPLVATYATLYHERVCPTVRLWFRPQAIYWHQGHNHSYGNARSLVTDPRGVSAEILVTLLRRFGAKL